MMEDKKLPDMLRMLVDRMWEHPDEFINPDWDPIQFNAWAREPFENVRWGNLIRAVMTTGKEIMFDEEEIEFIKLNYKELLRKQIEACIVKELVGGEREKEIGFANKQMNLPYTTFNTKIRGQY
jgi:hypothetical protein